MVGRWSRATRARARDRPSGGTVDRSELPFCSGRARVPPDRSAQDRSWLLPLGPLRPEPPTQSQAHLDRTRHARRRDKLGRSRPRYRGAVVEPEVAASDAHLRPIERRIRRLVAAGVDPAEVAWRFRRSRRSVSQILALSSRPDRGKSPSSNPQVLRPLERRILAWREAGTSYAEIGARFRHSPQFVRRVEDLARAKLARAENDDQ